MKSKDQDGTGLRGEHEGNDSQPFNEKEHRERQDFQTATAEYRGTKYLIHFYPGRKAADLYGPFEAGDKIEASNRPFHTLGANSLEMAEVLAKQFIAVNS